MPRDPHDSGPDLAVVSLWATGTDPVRDELFRVAAMRRDADGGWRGFDLFVAQKGGASEAATRRMQREFGVTAKDLEGAPSQEEAWAALEVFLAGAQLLVADRAPFEAWARALDAGDDPFARRWRRAGSLLALTEFHDLFLPGAPRPRPEATPEAVLEAFTAAQAAIATQDLATLSLEAHALSRAAEALWKTERPAAEVLTLALTLIEHPSRWARRSEALFDQDLTDGLFSRALEAFGDPEIALKKARPRWYLPFAELETEPPLPPLKDGTGPLSPDDRARIDEIFSVHLPEHFGAKAPRAGQRELAAEIAGRLGKAELLLSQAPTGTGKTLAYLVPLCLWAWRQDLRVGVATFTRALQDQAAEREVPLALAMLKRAGIPAAPRVVRLKGRANYLCWRALRRAVPLDEEPESGADAARLIAWAALVAFGATSVDGDLDSFPLGLSLPLASDDLARIARNNVLRSVRAETGCCATGYNRSTCGSEVARRRAERAHVVITNHSFVLARQEFLRHVVFDECEHLHDQAKSAWSHELTTGGLTRELGLVFRAKSAKGPLADALGAAPEGSFIEGVVVAAIDRQERAAKLVGGLERALVRFESWRQEEERRRAPRDRYGVFREYIQNGPSDQLIAAHREMVSALATLDAGMSSLLDHMEELPTKRRERIRDSLTTRRLALLDATNALDAWLPEDHEQATLVPRLSPEVFYAAAHEGGRLNDRLSAQVLLPQEELGSRYFPELESSVLISATTRIGGSFAAAASYLGLARTQTPREDESRDPRPFLTFHTPEVFDYSRVLCCVPRDAPSVRDRDRYLAFVARFVAHLARRTRGRALVLFTNARDLSEVARTLDEALVGSGIPVFAQNAGIAKEELAERFRERTDSILLGLDTFWYGADFPGETLEYLVIVRLPFGVPDDYHHAQEAAMGAREQRRAVYMPRALARFRQGFGRLMRKESDKGCVFILDKRVIEPRQRAFLRELPLEGYAADDEPGATHARLVRGETDMILDAAFRHMEMLPDIKRRGLDTPFAEATPETETETDEHTPFFPSEEPPF